MCTIFEKSENLEAVKTEQNMSIPRSTRSLICRICFDYETPSDPLIRPCSCSGTVAFVHNGCLEKWVKATHNIKCTICQDEFELIPAGLKNWREIQFPRPLSDQMEDSLEFGCTVAWVIYMMRFGYIGLRYGARSMVENVDLAIGTGSLRSLWWLSFWFNFLYYGAMCLIFYEKWAMDNSNFQFRDRSHDCSSVKSSKSTKNSTKNSRKILKLN